MPGFDEPGTPLRADRGREEADGPERLAVAPLAGAAAPVVTGAEVPPAVTVPGPEVSGDELASGEEPGVEPAAEATVAPVEREGERDTIFFALFPEPEAVARLGELARQLAAEHGLQGAPLDERFHVSLCMLGRVAELPEERVQRAMKAADGLAAGAFRVEFDRVGSFEKREDKKAPFVLMGGWGTSGVTEFRDELGQALEWQGIGGGRGGNFTPHLTLLWDKVRVEERDLEPVSWWARELRLVHSFVGQSRYETLKSWRLGGGGAES